MDIEVRGERDRKRARCAFCHEEVPAPELVGCESCRTLLHDECWRELGRCTTTGCAGRATPVEGERCVSCLRLFREEEGPLACSDCQLTIEDLLEHDPDVRSFARQEPFGPGQLTRTQLLILACVLALPALPCLAGLTYALVFGG